MRILPRKVTIAASVIFPWFISLYNICLFMHAYHSTVISLMKFSQASLENSPHRNTQKHSNALATLAIVNMYTCRYSEYVLQHEWGMKVLLVSVSFVVMAVVYATVHWSIPRQINTRKACQSGLFSIVD